MQFSVSRCLRLASYLLVACVANSALVGCKDELPPPTSGTLQIRLQDGTAGASTGARIYLDDELFTPSVDKDFYSEVLLAGSHTIRFEKACTAVSPTEEMTFVLAASEVFKVDWSVDVAGGLEVTSSVPGAEIYLDGVDTGRTTPTTFECLEPGTVTVSVESTGFSGGAPQDALVTDEVTTVNFTLEPQDQSRGAIVELLTAVECPNCLPADHAIEILWEDLSYAEAGIISVQVHHPWGGQDIFRTVETEARNTLYGFPPNSGSHPVTRTNGVTQTQTIGFPAGQTIPGFYEDMLERIAPFTTGDQSDPLVALHWLGEEFDEATHTATARMRVVCLGEIPAPSTTKVIGMIYKNGLVTLARVHGGPEEFYRVIRDIVDVGSCEDLGLESRGDWADVEFVYDLSFDTVWSEEEMGVIGLVQDFGTKEIFNVRHAFLQ